MAGGRIVQFPVVMMQFLIAFVLSVCTMAEARVLKCSAILKGRAESVGAVANEDIALIQRFWLTEDQIPLEPGSNKTPLLTFSTDSELTNADVLRLLLRHPRLLEKYERSLSGFSVDSVLRKLNVSLAQFKHFALRRGVDKEKNFYKPTEGRP